MLPGVKNAAIPGAHFESHSSSGRRPVLTSEPLSQRHGVLKAFSKQGVVLLKDCDGSVICFSERHQQTIVQSF